MKKQINSRWVIETGVWDKEQKDYTNMTKREFQKTIEVKIFRNPRSRHILQFIGGPTGSEAYYLYDLLPMDDKQGELCICAGTINSWPACYVQWADVKEFYEEFLGKG